MEPQPNFVTKNRFENCQTGIEAQTETIEIRENRFNEATAYNDDWKMSILLRGCDFMVEDNEFFNARMGIGLISHGERSGMWIRNNTFDTHTVNIWSMEIMMEFRLVVTHSVLTM